MEITIDQFEIIETETETLELQRVVELQDLQLTFVGGGIGDTCR